MRAISSRKWYVKNIHRKMHDGAKRRAKKANIAFNINGVNVYNDNGSGGSFTWVSAGASAGATNSSGIVYNIVVT